MNFNIVVSDEELELLKESLIFLLKNSSNSLEAIQFSFNLGEIEYSKLEYSRLYYKDKSDRIKKLIKNLPHVEKSLDLGKSLDVYRPTE